MKFTLQHNDPNSKARAGLIPDFTGISSLYENPLNPELILKTGELPLEQCAKQVMDYLVSVGKLV